MSTTTHETTFVLVPGARLGEWSWHPGARTAEHGHRVHAVTLLGHFSGRQPLGNSQTGVGSSGSSRVHSSSKVSEG